MAVAAKNVHVAVAVDACRVAISRCRFISLNKAELAVITVLFVLKLFEEAFFVLLGELIVVEGLVTILHDKTILHF